MSLEELPIELVGRICGFISIQDLVSFRLCSRATASGSLIEFGQRCFASIRFLITSKNMQVLSSIAHHEHFRTVVRGLYVVPALFEGRYDMDRTAYQHYVAGARTGRTLFASRARRPEIEVPQEKLAEYHSAYQEVVADHLDIVTSGKLDDTIRYCVSRFPNLDSVGLSHYSAERQDIFRVTRHLDCPEWRELVPRLGCDPAIPWRIISPFGHNVPNVRAISFSSLLKSTISPGAKNLNLREITTCQARSEQFRCCSGLMLGPLGLSEQEQDTILSRLESMCLKKLHLCLRDYNEQRHPDSYLFVQKIAARVSPSVVDFRSMRSPTHEGLEYSQQQFSWLAHHASFTRLTTIHLAGIRTSVDDLQRLLGPAAATLRQMHLGDIFLVDRDFSSPDLEAKARSGRQMWRTVWNWFSENFDPTYMNMTCLCGPGPGQLRIRDRMHGLNGSNQLINASNVAIYLKSKSLVPFDEWIHQLKFEKFLSADKTDDNDAFYSE